MYSDLKKNKFISDFIKQMSGTLLAQIIAIIAIPIITRIYSPEEYGEYTILIQVLMGFSIIITLRFEHFIVLSESIEESYNNLLAIIVIGIGICFFIIFSYLIIGPSVPIFNLLEMNFSVFLIIIIFGLILSVNCGLEQFLQKQRVFFKSSLSEVVSKFAFLVLAVIFSFFELNYNGIFFAFCIGFLFKFFYLVVIVKGKKTSKDTKFSLKGLVPFKVRSLTLVYSHFLLVFTQLIPFSYIVTNYGNDLMGQFSLAFSTLNLVATIGAFSMSKVYFQRMSETKDKSDMKKLWRNTFIISLCIGFPLYLFIYFLSNHAYGFIFGNEWNMAGIIATYLVVSSFFEFISRPMESTSLVLNVWWYTPTWHTLRVISMIIMTHTLDPSMISFVQFLYVFVGIMSILFILDLVFQGYLVSKRK